MKSTLIIITPYEYKRWTSGFDVHLMDATSFVLRVTLTLLPSEAGTYVPADVIQDDKE
jgi:hypothetical protein